MGINAKQLREYIIQPTLKHIGLYSNSAEELLVLTAAQESHQGKYIHQLGRGPACGIFQMEPNTHDDIYNNYLRYKSDLLNRIDDFDLPCFAGRGVGTAIEMCGNNYYATAMCRIHYLRVPKGLPNANDIHGIARYWKEHYNTYLGAGTVSEAVDNYRRFA